MMNMNQLIANCVGREKRYAVMKNNKVEKVFIEQPKQHSLVGNIYLGIVTKVLPGMNAVFVNIGEEKQGYLQRDKIPAFFHSSQSEKEGKRLSSFVHQGEKLLVQVEKDATGNKGPRLTGILEFNGPSIVYMPKGCYVAVSKKLDEEQREKWRKFGSKIKNEEEGILFRTSCKFVTEDAVFQELKMLREKYENLVKHSQMVKGPRILMNRNHFLEKVISEIGKIDEGQVYVDDLKVKKELEKSNQNGQIQFFYHGNQENIFETYGVEGEIHKALKRVVWLENGAYCIFDEAEALTIVDVNTGKYSGKNNLEETVVKTNERAAVEIARQIRLRNIGGMILIDFIDMKKEEDRIKIISLMESQFADDDNRTSIIGFTPLGILQLTRKRTKVSLSEELTTHCPVCEGTGKVLSAESVAFRLERELMEHRRTEYEAVLIETTKEVKEVFVGPQNQYLKHMEEFLGLKCYFSIQEGVKPYYSIRQFGNVEDIYKKINL